MSMVWMNGELVDATEARLNILAHSLHYGTAVFEGDRAYLGRVFKSNQHSMRLIQSAQTIGFDVGYSAEEIDEAKSALVQNMVEDFVYLRTISWIDSDNYGVSIKGKSVHLAVRAFVSKTNLNARLKKIKLGLSNYKLPPPECSPVQSKVAGRYMLNTIARNHAQQRGFDDALMLDWRGFVGEATTANIFFVHGDVLVTPLADCFLNGITRQTVITLAESLGIQVIERHVSLNELADFHECFLTGTAIEMKSVASIADTIYKRQNITTKLHNAFHKAVLGASGLPTVC